MANNNLELNDVHETLLLPLWGRAMEMKKTQPLLEDKKAESIVNSLSYDFSKFTKKINKLSRDSWIARSLYFDKEINDYIRENNTAVIINIGCGLDTTFERIDNGKILWYDLDVPEVIDLKKKYFKETSRYKFIAKSAFDYSWMDEIDEKQQIMIILAGVIYYFEEDQIKELVSKLKEHFYKIDIVFDYCSNRGLKIANKHVIEKGEMSKSAYLKWAVDDIKDMTIIDKDIKVVNSQPMFKDFKKHLKFIERTGHIFSDALKIMSLVHIRIVL